MQHISKFYHLPARRFQRLFSSTFLNVNLRVISSPKEQSGHIHALHHGDFVATKQSALQMVAGWHPTAQEKSISSIALVLLNSQVPKQNPTTPIALLSSGPTFCKNLAHALTFGDKTLYDCCLNQSTPPACANESNLSKSPSSGPLTAKS
mmetsp:Transcript_2537/g.5535  ORF Transcript_2537/g.5535 Transcript_2537/m.5535 type:complete len:150 (+) Transcript_2537:177-626(+)